MYKLPRPDFSQEADNQLLDEEFDNQPNPEERNNIIEFCRVQVDNFMIR